MYYEAITKRSSRTDIDEVGHFSSFKKWKMDIKIERAHHSLSVYSVNIC